jgi:hypothetical protein
MRQASQLLAPTAASVADATLFTTSNLGVTIVRMINVCNTAATAATFSLAIGGTAATAANCINATQTIPANTTAQVFGPFTVPASTAIHGLASATTVTFEASGELSVAGG